MEDRSTKPASKLFLFFELIFIVFGIVVAFHGTNFTQKTWASTSTSTAQTISITVNQVITLTLGTPTLNLSALTPGTAIVATTTATVMTNAAAGWELEVNRNSTTTATSFACSSSSPTLGSKSNSSIIEKHTLKNEVHQKWLESKAKGDEDEAESTTGEIAPATS